MRSICLLSDVHIPDHDRAAWGAALHFIADTQPDEIVLLGDFLDLESVNQYGHPHSQLVDELEAGREALTELRRRAPAATITYLRGNHDDRLERIISARIPGARGVISLAEVLGLDELGIRWVPQKLERGDLVMIHGDQLGDRTPAMHTQKAAREWSAPGRTVVYGHTHKPQESHIAGAFGNAYAFALGTLQSFYPGYLKSGPASGWVHGFAVAYVRPSGRVNLYRIRIEEGCFVFGGRTYGAATAPA